MGEKDREKLLAEAKTIAENLEFSLQTGQLAQAEAEAKAIENRLKELRKGQ